MGEDLKAFCWAIVICVTFPLTVHLARVGAISDVGQNTSYLAGLVYDYQALITGLVASFAAFVTLSQLRRQVQVTQMQARDAFRFQLRRSIAVAKNAIRLTDEFEAWFDIFHTKADNLANPDGFESYKRLLGTVEATLNIEVFDLVEREIGFPSKNSIVFLRSIVRNIRFEKAKELRAATIDEKYERTLAAASMNRLLKDCQEYGLQIRSICQALIDDSDSTLRRYE